MDTINISGVTYYKLNSEYSGDTTKNCSLAAAEIDRNFYTLRGLDIESISVNDNVLTLKRLNGDTLSTNIETDVTVNNYNFSYDKTNGTLTITHPDGTVDVLSGFTKNAITEIRTDNSLIGKGSTNDPLKVNPINRTGTYSPANEYIELLPSESLPKSGITPGYRVVTKEITDIFGKLYSKDGISVLANYLEENNSEWRIPTKEDWDLLLNGLELDEYKNHSASTIGFLGRDAAQPLKSDFLWKYNNNPIYEDCTCGFDVHGFNIVPVGQDEDGDKISNGFNESSILWTSTEINDETYVKEFSYDENRVGQKLITDGFYAVRLVKNFNENNYKGIEGIFNQNYPTILIPQINQIWTTINVYATKKQFPEDLSKNVNFIDVNTEGANFNNAKTTFYVNEWNGIEWIKTELIDGDSIVIYSKDTNDGETRYYRRWQVKDDELISFEDFVNHALDEIIDNFNSEIEQVRTNLLNNISELNEQFRRFVTEELEGTIKRTVKNYIIDTTNEISVKEENGKLKIGFSDNAIFGI